MPTILRLTVLERDLAVAFSRSETEAQAISALLAAFVSFDPECGVAIHLPLEKREEPICAGALGAEALAFALRGSGSAASPELDANRFCLAQLLSDDRGAFGRLAFIADAGPESVRLVGETVERAGEMLSAALSRIRAVRELEAAAKDRDLLVREIRHRTRNSLQLIKGSIGLFVGTLAGAPSHVLAELDERLGALVAVHDMLSWTESSASVSAENYFIQLAEALRRISPEGIGTLIAYYDAEEDVSLPVDRAATMGLIVHELVMNTAKHAAGRLLRMSVRVACADGFLLLRYEETAVSSPFDLWSERVPDVSAAAPARAMGGRGLEIIKALIGRARGRRLDDGSDRTRFLAAFPLD